MSSTRSSAVPRFLVPDPARNPSAELTSIDCHNIGIIESVVPCVCSGHRAVDRSNASISDSVAGSDYRGTLDSGAGCCRANGGKKRSDGEHENGSFDGQRRRGGAARERRCHYIL